MTDTTYVAFSAAILLSTHDLRGEIFMLDLKVVSVDRTSTYRANNEYKI